MKYNFLISNITEDQPIDPEYPLSSEEAAVYAEVFGERYWWGTPDCPPVHSPQSKVKASLAGKLLLGLYPNLNGGIVQLGDAHEFNGSVLRADKLRRGTIIKTVVEVLVKRIHTEDTDSESLTTATTSDEGFMITRYFGKSFACYKQMVFWSTTAGSSKGRRAFFPLNIDHGSSLSSELSGGVRPSLKIVSSQMDMGTKEIRLRQTLGTRNELFENFSRVAYAGVCQPLQTVPRRKLWSPQVR